MEEMGFGPTLTEFQDTVHDYVVANEISIPFVDNRPGYEWAASFLQRHNLKLKKGGTMQLARKNVTADPFVIYGYYDLLQGELHRLGLSNRPECIWNLDETGFPHDPSKCKTIGSVGKKTIHVVCGANRENTTVLAVCCADGTALPPVVVFKGKHMQSTWKGTQEIPGTQYSVSENGWMTTLIFEDIFKHFVEQTKDRRPLLLILDGHISHTSIATIELAKKENISILKLPAHCTDVLQPLDVACFAPLKHYYEAALNDHVHKTGAREPLRKCGFVNMLSSVWEKGLAPQNVKKGFESTGIFPCDSAKYKKSRLNPLKLKTYEKWIAVGSPRDDQGEPLLDPLAIHPQGYTPDIPQMQNQSSMRLSTGASTDTSTDLEGPTMDVSIQFAEASDTLLCSPVSRSVTPVTRPTTPATRPVTPLSPASTSSTSAAIQGKKSTYEFHQNDPVLSQYSGLELSEILHSLPIDVLIKEIQRRAPDKMRYCVLLQPANEETTLEAVIQTRGKPLSSPAPTRRRINMKAKIITGEEIDKQLEKKSKSKCVRKRKVSFESDSEDDPELMVDLDDTDDMDDNVETLVDEREVDEHDHKEESFCMPVLDDNAVGKFYAVFYSTPIKSYYWGKVTKTFENDENESVLSVEIDFLRRKNISSDPEKLTWLEPVQKDVQIVSSDFVFFGPAKADVLKVGHLKFPDKDASNAFMKFSLIH